MKHLNEDIFRIVFDTATDGIITINSERIIVSFNKGAEKIFGYRAHEVIGKNVNMLMPKREADMHDRYVKNYLNTGIRSIIGKGREVMGVHKNGAEVYLHLSIGEGSSSSENGKIFTAIIRDITTQKLNENQLVESETMHRSLIETAVDGIITMNSDRIIQSFNRSAEKIFGYRAFEVLGKNVKILMPDQLKKKHDGYVKEYMDTGVKRIIGTGREVTGRHKTGKEIYLHLSIGEIKIGTNGERLFTAFIRDITVEKRNEIELLESESKNRTLIETAVDGIITINGGGMIQTVNKAAELLFNYREFELISQSIGNLMPDLGRVYKKKSHDNSIMKEIEGVIGASREIIGKRKNGSPFFINLSVGEAKIGNSKESFYTLIMRDITEQKNLETELKTKKLELERIVSNLEVTNEELNQFAYIISHDLKAPMRGIQSLSDWLLEEYNDKLDEEGTGMITKISDKVATLNKLIDDLLSFSQIGKTDKNNETFNLGTTLKSVIEVLDLGGVELKFPHKYPNLHTNKLAVFQIFQNLFSNAVKYNTSETKKIEFKISENKKFHIFSVKDNGIGINVKYHEKIFKLFETINGKSKESTGVGLSIVAKRIATLGGKITIDSEEGKGSTFHVYIPKV